MLALLRVDKKLLEYTPLLLTCATEIAATTSVKIGCNNFLQSLSESFVFGQNRRLVVVCIDISTSDLDTNRLTLSRPVVYTVRVQCISLTIASQSQQRPESGKCTSRQVWRLWTKYFISAQSVPTDVFPYRRNFVSYPPLISFLFAQHFGTKQRNTFENTGRPIFGWDKRAKAGEVQNRMRAGR